MASVGVVEQVRAVHDPGPLQGQPEPELPLGADALQEPGEALTTDLHGGVAHGERRIERGALGRAGADFVRPDAPREHEHDAHTRDLGPFRVKCPGQMPRPGRRCGTRGGAGRVGAIRLFDGGGVVSSVRHVSSVCSSWPARMLEARAGCALCETRRRAGCCRRLVSGVPGSLVGVLVPIDPGGWL
ncbi:hypothetical protein ACQP2P_25805 [Dactylosporangium sp. CA-139114]|uniref:hypothetical protein n=1 Tax=Dactylosporangium sp. CA-139114 TaxID=3239931 RepID=UPI003D97567D